MLGMLLLRVVFIIEELVLVVILNFWLLWVMNLIFGMLIFFIVGSDDGVVMFLLKGVLGVGVFGVVFWMCGVIGIV